MLGLLAPFLISFLLTALLTPLVIFLARRQGWVSLPREDRWHSRPTALMGGIAICGGTLAAWLVTGDLKTLAPIAFPAAAIFLLGVIDDRVYEFRPHQKLIAQVAIALALIAGGVRFTTLPPLLSLPLTLLWLVGITNAVNLLDNMDGLASGVSAIACLVLASYCFGTGDAATAAMLLALAGGCAGFLLYNSHPARIFMGDCGSMFIGLSLAALSIRGTHRDEPGLLLSLLIPIAALAVPIFDTSLVALARAMHGRPILPGYRDHSSHRMVSLGLSERATVLVLYVVTAASGALALAARQLSLPLVLLLTVLLGTGLIVLGHYLGLVKVYPEAPNPPAHVRVFKMKLLYRRNVLQVILDVILVPIAFTGAHVLRFDGDLPPTFVEGVLAALPLVVSVKLVSLLVAGAYRGVWRYAGMADALTACTGSLLASALLLPLLGFFFGFDELSRSALVIDWVLFTALAVTARMGYSVLRHVFGTFPRPGARRVVILGAGEDGVALIQRGRDPLAAQQVQVIGILDDDPVNQRRALNGVPVLGRLADLPELAARENVAFCVLGVAPHSRVGQQILEYCGKQKIAVYLGLEGPALLPVGEPGGPEAEGRPAGVGTPA